MSTTPTPRPASTLRKAIEAANLAALDVIGIHADLRARLLAAASAAMRAELDGRIEPQKVTVSPDEHKSLVDGLTSAGHAMNLGLVRVSLVLTGPALDGPADEDAHLD